MAEQRASIRPTPRNAAKPLPRNVAKPLPRNVAGPLPRNAATPLMRSTVMPKVTSGAPQLFLPPPLIIRPATTTEPRSVFPMNASLVPCPFPQPTMPAALLPRQPAPNCVFSSSTSLPPFNPTQTVEERTVEEEFITYGQSLRTREKHLKTRRAELLQELRSLDREIADNKAETEKFDVMARKSGIDLPAPGEPAFKLKRIEFTPPDPRQSIANLVRSRPTKSTAPHAQN